MIEKIPAIDIIGGQCVRLTKGDYNQKNIYHDSPVEVAVELERKGFHRLHIVDLDGAKSKHIVNGEILRQIKAATHLVVDFGGGIKSEEDIETAFACGADMVTIGSVAVKEKELLQKYLSGSPSVLPEEIYLDLPEARRKLINPIMEPDELFLKRWKSQPYPNMATRREHPVIFNDQGTEVDSKAELAISNQFDKRNIAFLPQFPVYLKARGWVYADFKVLNLRTRREYYWEHLGMLDSAAYRKHSLPKLNAYILNGYVPGDNLILSWESEESRLDMRVIDSLIDAFLI